MSLNNQHHQPSVSSTSYPTPLLPNRSLLRSPQARQDLHRDLHTKWYYKKVSSVHNGLLVRQEYRVTVRIVFSLGFGLSLIAFGL